jgi:hypothetical protein
VVNGGGMVWEGENDYPTCDAAFADADAGIAEWFGEDESTAPAPTPKKSARGKTAKKKNAGLKRVPVDSSMLTAVGYDESTKELEAVFRSGAVWRYRGVSKKVYRELLAASSKGSYMRSCIIGMYSDYQVR